MPIMNEFLCGHIVFTTAVAPNQPVALAGAYNASVTRSDTDPGIYIVRVGAALAPPLNPDLDASISNSLTQAGGWANAVLGAVSVDTNGDRLYTVNVFQEAAGLVIVSDTAGVTVRLTVKRVEPRTS
jgi:hypothetical protein